LNRWREFIEDNKGIGSGTSLAFLFTVAVLGFCTLFMTFFRAYLEAVSMAGVLAGAAGLTKMTAKWNESSVEKASMNPDPAPVLPPVLTQNINTAAPEKKE